MTIQHVTPSGPQGKFNPTSLIVAGEQTMSSREIADLLGKQHGHVMRDIRHMLAELHGEGGVSRFGDTLRNGQNGQEYPIFRLPKRETLILVSGYDIGLRTKIIDRWTELEATAAPAADPLAALNDPATMRGLLLTYTEKVLQLQAANVALSDKADALDRIATAEGSLSVTEAAKALQVRPKELFDYLSRHGWTYKRPGASTWLGYQAHTSAGDLEHKVTTVLRADGSERVCEQVRITPRGLAKLAKLLPGRMTVIEGDAP